MTIHCIGDLFNFTFQTEENIIHSIKPSRRPLVIILLLISKFVHVFYGARLYLLLRILATFIKNNFSWKGTTETHKYLKKNLNINIKSRLRYIWLLNLFELVSIIIFLSFILSFCTFT